VNLAGKWFVHAGTGCVTGSNSAVERALSMTSAGIGRAEVFAVLILVVAKIAPRLRFQLRT